MSRLRPVLTVVERPRLVLATGNPGKLRELTALLGDRFVIEPRPSDLAETVEDGKTLLDNATKKALEVFLHTGSMAMADDTGLFVAALDGKPGVRSARYAGLQADDADNRAKLIDDLDAVAGDPVARQAYFETVVAIVGPPGEPASSTDGIGGGRSDRSTDSSGGSGPGLPQLVPIVGRGRVYGHIVDEARGERGFGYDSLFQPAEGDGRTFAEMDLAEKQAISHRSRALSQVVELLADRR